MRHPQRLEMRRDGPSLRMPSHGDKTVKLYICDIDNSCNFSWRPISEPIRHDTARWRARSTSHPVALLKGRTNIPLAAGKDQENETILQVAFLSHGHPRFVQLDPPGHTPPGRLLDLIFSGSSNLLHLGTVDDDARSNIFPKYDEQLACQCSDCRFLAATAVSHTLFEPAAQRGVRLMAQPESGEFDACGAAARQSE